MEREKMVAEAVNRMHRLKMLNNPIREFEKDGILNKSENGGTCIGWMIMKRK